MRSTLYGHDALSAQHLALVLRRNCCNALDTLAQKLHNGAMETYLNPTISNREAAKLSQARLASRLGVHITTVQRNERNANPPIQYILAVAYICDLRIKWMDSYFEPKGLVRPSKVHLPDFIAPVMEDFDADDLGDYKRGPYRIAGAPLPSSTPALPAADAPPVSAKFDVMVEGKNGKPYYFTHKELLQPNPSDISWTEVCARAQARRVVAGEPE